MFLTSCEIEKEEKRQNLKFVYILHHTVVSQTTLLVALVQPTVRIIQQTLLPMTKLNVLSLYCNNSAHSYAALLKKMVVYDYCSIN